MLISSFIHQLQWEKKISRPIIFLELLFSKMLIGHLLSLKLHMFCKCQILLHNFWRRPCSNWAGLLCTSYFAEFSIPGQVTALPSLAQLLRSWSWCTSTPTTNGGSSLVESFCNCHFWLHPPFSLATVFIKEKIK